MADNNPNTINRLIKKIGNRIAKNKNRIEIVVLKTAEGLMKQRIFNNGKASNGSQIGQYSTKDMLIGASSFANKTNANSVLGSKKKRKGLDWVTVKGRRLAVLNGGYRHLRRLQGFQTGYVDLEINGDLRRSIVTGKSVTGGNALGFFNDEQRIIGESQEKRFKKDIFALSPQELKAMDKAFVREVDKILSSL